MKAITRIRGGITVLERVDVDTDQIVPKQFLKRLSREGMRDALFYDWRRDGQLELASNPILVAGRNFGCGSSREHAVWALMDYGFEAVVAPSFGDIFATNCTKNGMLPVVLADREVARLARASMAAIDLRSLTVAFDGDVCSFHLGEEQRNRLLRGVDDIDVTLGMRNAIERFEGAHRSGLLSTIDTATRSKTMRVLQ